MRRRHRPRGPQVRVRARVGFEHDTTRAPHGAYCASFEDLAGTRVRLFAAPQLTPEVLVVRPHRVPR